MKSVPVNYSKSIDVNYQRVKLQGKFLYDKQIFLYSLNDKGKPGYDVVTPMLTTANEYILINRGWIEKKFKNDLKINNFKGNQINGIIKKISKPNIFKPKNEIWDDYKCSWIKDDGCIQESFPDNGTLERIQQFLENMDQRE